MPGVSVASIIQAFICNAASGSSIPIPEFLGDHLRQDMLWFKSAFLFKILPGVIALQYDIGIFSGPWNKDAATRRSGQVLEHQGILRPGVRMTSRASALNCFKTQKAMLANPALATVQH